MARSSSPRAIICPDCGKLTPAGRRGPLPTRCRRCRAWRRRPVLPERVAGKTTCSKCGAEVPVRGERGRLPLYCRPCRREAANARRRAGPPIMGLLTVADWAPYMPPRMEWLPPCREAGRPRPRLRGCSKARPVAPTGARGSAGTTRTEDRPCQPPP